jgi:hypothetical protein
VAISLIGSTYGPSYPGAYTASTSVAPITLAVDDIIVMCCATAGAYSTNLAFDDIGNVYTEETASRNAYAGYNKAFWTAKSAYAGSAYFFNGSGTGPAHWIQGIWVLRGCDPTAWVDVSNSDSGTNFYAPITTSVPNCAVLVSGESSAGYMNPNGDAGVWVDDGHDGPNWYSSWGHTLDVGAAGAHTPGFDYNGGGTTLHVIAIRPAGAPAGTFPPVPHALIGEAGLNTLLRM